MTTPQPPQRPNPANPDPAGTRPWWKKKRFALPAGAFVALLAISPFVPKEDESTSTAASQATTTTTTEQQAQEPATTTAPATTTSTTAATTQPPTTTTTQSTTTTQPTTTTQVEQVECEGGGAAFVPAAGVTCEDVYAEARRVIRSFDGFDQAQDAFFEMTAGILCSAATGTDPVTYEPESTYIPAVADALIDRYCPGERNLIVVNN